MKARCPAKEVAWSVECNRLYYQKMKACVIRSIIHYLYDISSLPVSMFGNSPWNYVNFIHFCSSINKKTALLQALNFKGIKNPLIRADNDGQKMKPCAPAALVPLSAQAAPCPHGTEPGHPWGTPGGLPSQGVPRDGHRAFSREVNGELWIF